MSFATRSCKVSITAKQVDVYPDRTFDSSESCRVKAIVMLRAMESQEQIKHQIQDLFLTKRVFDCMLSS
jgi:hypothetical protein